MVEILNLEGKRPYKKIEGTDIYVENLRFSYEGNDSFALDGISFSVTKGEHLAIVGKSGSGKSTIAKLLTGKIKPQGGIVRIGDIDIYAVNSESLSEKVSIVVQEPVLFNMTIKENLLLAKGDATDAELIDCCRRASIYDFIETLHHKLDTIIGEKGVKLSGGRDNAYLLLVHFYKTGTSSFLMKVQAPLTTKMRMTSLQNLSAFHQAKR
ncbi:ATP-binding cassette domain-containing protein [Paenibacillus sp. TH7-28]